ASRRDIAARGQHRARERVVGEGSGNRGRGVHLRPFPTTTLFRSRRVAPGDGRGSLEHVDRDALGGGGVIGGIGRSEGDRQGLTSSGEQKCELQWGGGVVGGIRGGGVQLGRAQSSRVGDVRRVAPG